VVGIGLNQAIRVKEGELAERGGWLALMPDVAERPTVPAPATEVQV
jgi:hypothetical protein